MASEREHQVIAEADVLLLPDAGPVVLLPDMPATPRPQAATACLMPWLALWLAREGRSVLVHGPQADGGAAEVLLSLGIARALHAGDVGDRWARREPAVVATALLAPGGHMADPAWQHLAPRGPKRCLRVLSCQVPGSERDAAAWAARSGSAALLLAGAPLADPRHCPRVEVWLGGHHRPDLGTAAADEPPALWAPLPRGTSAAATALFVQELMSGERPMPGPWRQLARLVGRAIDAAAQEA